MRRIILISFCSISLFGSAQQTAEYSQYVLNSFGFNPASCGNSTEYEVLFGRREQWKGYGGPLTQFVSVNRGFLKKSYKKYWHGVGIYIEDDAAGLMDSKQTAAAYSFHLRVARGYTAAFGVSIGSRLQSHASSLSTMYDPALTLYPPVVRVTPDINAGARFYSKKFFADISVRQIFKNKVEQGSKILGTPSLLSPHIYATMGERFYSEDYYYMFEPSVHLQSTFTGFPSVSAGAMLYINKRVGIGLFGRWPESVYGVLQVRVYKNILIGYAYDYTLSRMHVASANSQEFMVGISPVLSVENFPGKTSNTNCPVFDF